MGKVDQSKPNHEASLKQQKWLHLVTCFTEYELSFQPSSNVRNTQATQAIILASGSALPHLQKALLSEAATGFSRSSVGHLPTLDSLSVVRLLAFTLWRPLFLLSLFTVPFSTSRILTSTFKFARLFLPCAVIFPHLSSQSLNFLLSNVLLF